MEYQQLDSPLPWIDGDTPDGETHIWDANGTEVDLYRYSALLVHAMNTYLAVRSEITRAKRLVTWLRRVITGTQPS